MIRKRVCFILFLKLFFIQGLGLTAGILGYMAIVNNDIYKVLGCSLSSNSECPYDWMKMERVFVVVSLVCVILSILNFTFGAYIDTESSRRERAFVSNNNVIKSKVSIFNEMFSNEVICNLINCIVVKECGISINVGNYVYRWLRFSHQFGYLFEERRTGIHSPIWS
jgi:hypothetical protein